MSMIYQNSLWCLGVEIIAQKIYLLPKISPEPYDCGFDLLACIVASDISANTPFVDIPLANSVLRWVVNVTHMVV